MPNNINFVPAICPQCGAQLNVNPETDAAVCEYCNTPFVVEKAINKYNITNHIQNTTVVNQNTKRGLFDLLAAKKEAELKQQELLYRQEQEQREYFAAHPEEFKKRAIGAIIALAVIFGFLFLVSFLH